MSKPLGGRGKKAPYESVMVRTPLPVKADVEAVISNFRSQFSESQQIDLEPVQRPEIEQAIKLVYEFMNEKQLTEKLADYKRYRNMRELVQFLNWLRSQNSSDPDTL